MPKSGAEIISATLEYVLPERLIALDPADRREEAKLLVVNRGSGSVAHTKISSILSWLSRGDLLVFNDTKVEPARVIWTKPGGGKSEIIFLKYLSETDGRSRFEALLSGKRLRPGSDYPLPGGMTMHLLSRGEHSFSEIELSGSRAAVREWLQTVGKPPLPPYIRKARKRAGRDEDDSRDAARYQTEFARVSGAVAAPTAGLHFSNDLMVQLETAGVERAFVTLHVGWGTFQPLEPEQWAGEKLHAEHVTVPSETVEQIKRTKESGKRVIAVGTTVVRSLEWWAREGANAEGLEGECELFLKPPWTPKIVDAMVTNFHLPGSSLLALVAGFLGENGVDKVKELYQDAIRREYRFFSYGDAMLIV